MSIQVFALFFLDLFIFREGKRGRKRGTETSVCGCLSCASYWGPGLQCRHVPWLGIEPVTFGLRDSTPTNWATPARAQTHGLQTFSPISWVTFLLCYFPLMYKSFYFFEVLLTYFFFCCLCSKSIFNDNLSHFYIFKAIFKRKFKALKTNMSSMNA